MAQTSVAIAPKTPPWVTLNMRSIAWTDEQFYRLCQDNPELRLELTAQKELVIMSPTGTKTGWQNSKLNQRLANWAEEDGSGLTFDSSTGFTLPNGAKRSPDAAWVQRQRWEVLTEADQEGFAPFCPDFVVELRSPNDRLSILQNKMEEYTANGAQLGWLLDTKNKRVYIYRSTQPVQRLENPNIISGDPILPGFVLDLHDIW
jgi:Uma2 family endonuclease